MSSKTDIINAAIDLLGEDAVINPTQKQEAARRLERRWDNVRDAVLEECRWNFAGKRASLASVTPPVGHWGAVNVFEKPSDCLKIRSAGPKGAKWQVEGTRIVSDAGSPLQILYTKRVSDPTTFSATFNEALSARLAWVTAWAVTGDKGIVDRMFRGYSDLMATARHSDAVEQSAQELESSEWLQGMLIGPGNPFGSDEVWWG